MFCALEAQKLWALDERAFQGMLLLLFAVEAERSAVRFIRRAQSVFLSSCFSMGSGILFRARICSSIVKRTLTKAEFNFIIQHNHCRCSSTLQHHIFLRSCYQRSFIICHCRRTREGRTGGEADIGAGVNKSDRVLFYNHLHLRANIFYGTLNHSAALECSTELNHSLC